MMRIPWEELDQDELDEDIEREFLSSIDPAAVPPWLGKEDLGLDSDSDSDSSSSESEETHVERIDNGSPSPSPDHSSLKEHSPSQTGTGGNRDTPPGSNEKITGVSVFDSDSWGTIGHRVASGFSFLDNYGPSTNP
jgi:hypothetical protein